MVGPEHGCAQLAAPQLSPQLLPYGSSSGSSSSMQHAAADNSKQQPPPIPHLVRCLMPTGGASAVARPASAPLPALPGQAGAREAAAAAGASGEAPAAEGWPAGVRTSRPAPCCCWEAGCHCMVAGSLSSPVSQSGSGPAAALALWRGVSPCSIPSSTCTSRGEPGSSGSAAAPGRARAAGLACTLIAAGALRGEPCCDCWARDAAARGGPWSAAGGGGGGGRDAPAGCWRCWWWWWLRGTLCDSSAREAWAKASDCLFWICRISHPHWRLQKQQGAPEAPSNEAGAASCIASPRLSPSGSSTLSGWLLLRYRWLCRWCSWSGSSWMTGPVSLQQWAQAGGPAGVACTWRPRRLAGG